MIATAPARFAPLLMLDSYQCQMMALVVSSIQQISMRVDHIPGGCTSLCQPVHVRTERSLKAHNCKNKGGLDAGILDN